MGQAHGRLRPHVLVRGDEREREREREREKGTDHA